ncbi:MAG TPA: c-type cytochrome [Gammaproteobacteria bacterium]|nr:c-type cytochrome [Gammaproteobacteria bacterium]
MRVSILLALGCALLAGCGEKSGLGFRLPDGSPERGRAAFLTLRCTACHQVVGLDVPNQGTGMANVTLGGETVRVKNYGELVTAIINPSHRIAPGYPLSQVTTPDGQSLMTLAYLNDVMTVQQLIDLVAFLQASYQVMPPLVSPYSYVYP